MNENVEHNFPMDPKYILYNIFILLEEAEEALQAITEKMKIHSLFNKNNIGP